MGVKLLNTFMRTSCKEGIKKLHLSQLKNKKIAVDASIYMYRFLGENSLLENFYHMCSILRHYNIHPIFVFDGKPPVEKSNEMKDRYYIKKNAEKKYKELEVQLKGEKEQSNREELEADMDKLRKQFLRITKKHVQQVKELLDAYGISHIDAPNEADQLCAYLTIKKITFACLSEDMDMFVYGCPYIMRYFSILNHTTILYDVEKVVHGLGMSMNIFHELCVLSGTDYNKTRRTIFQYYNKVKLFKKSGYRSLFQFICENYRFENQEELENVRNIYSLKTLENELIDYNNLVIKNKTIDKTMLHKLLEKEWFIFI